MHCGEESSLAVNVLGTMTPLEATPSCHLARGDDTYFEPADKESIRSQFSIAVNPILQQSENTPENIQSWNGPLHGNVSEQEHERDLSCHRADDIERLELDQLVALETKVLLETSNICII